MFLRLPLGLAAIFGLILGPTATRAAQPPGKSHGISRQEWNVPRKPFRIYGNTWYVGPYGLSSLVVDTGKGLALFDGGLPASAPLIEANIRALGFHVRDVKWILNSHAHADHAGGIAALQRDSGAQVIASAEGARALALGGADPADPQYGLAPAYPPVAHVRPVGDGETLRLGDVAITAHYTPGHTPGSTSWTWISCSAGRCLHMVYADSLTALGSASFRYSDHPERVEAFRQSIATVAALPCDILLTPHPDASGFWEKVAQRKADAGGMPLVDADGCRAYATAATIKLDATLAREKAKTATQP
ncbi:subclass B3 metallo-beta-lactamase [Frateuria terrea]|uniref:beta-lactamase n=1 Tax=Frateuria terrea TaxID=529704 RepID=A0A1H6ZMH5_9GAMM|nr:subclass B3 metallo-beta-lactamase [Frateuria terrea]SEJ50892.1 metallo-beta-lactamase class B [Frateuria terrea]SFP79098.1 metallo-beta-lactamase class B [Frateuria terrea]